MTVDLLDTYRGWTTGELLDEIMRLHQAIERFSMAYVSCPMCEESFLPMLGEITPCPECRQSAALVLVGNDEQDRRLILHLWTEDIIANADWETPLNRDVLAKMGWGR